MIGATKEAVYLYLYGNRHKALKIVQDFRIGVSPQEREIFQRGRGAVTNPSFYESLGYDIEKLVNDAHALFEEKFIKPRMMNSKESENARTSQESSQS